MPLPIPNPDESRDEWMSRCMGHEGMMSEFDAQDQRTAVCMQKWRDKDQKSSGQSVEIKALEGFEIKNETSGEVVAVVATLGVVDRDGDVILPGAFASSKTAKISRYGHSMVLHGDEPVGKGKITEENGKAVFRGRYFMSTPGGSAAFGTVKELAEDTEWSFGFNQVKQGKMTPDLKAAGARRVIEGMNAFEVSPVYLGAGIGTGTMAVKHAKEAAEEAAAEAEKAEEAEKAATEAAEKAQEAAAEATKAAEETAEAKRLLDEAEAKRLQEEIDRGFERFQRTRRLFNL